jgi:hypothetical protein
MILPRQDKIINWNIHTSIYICIHGPQKQQFMGKNHQTNVFPAWLRNELRRLLCVKILDELRRNKTLCSQRVSHADDGGLLIRCMLVISCTHIS